MIERNVERNHWGTYHEDIREKPETHLSAEPMSFTAGFLFRRAKAKPEYLEMGKQIMRRLEEKLVHTDGHPAAPAPAVSEQSTFQHMMPGHTARYCLALTHLHAATGDAEAKRKALSGFNALTYMQSEHGLFRTMFQLVNERRPNRKREWPSMLVAGSRERSCLRTAVAATRVLVPPRLARRPRHPQRSTPLCVRRA